MNYCSRCGGAVRLQVPAGDDRERHVCTQCGHIHYLNPRLVVGCIAEWEDRILLCRRAIEPRYGLWTVPAGYLEHGESTEEAGMRETWEEAVARVEILSLYSLYSLPHIGQVYLIYRARLTEPAYAPGRESLEVGLFTEAEIPWDALAFPVVEQSLRAFFDDRRRGSFELRTGTVAVTPWKR